MEKNHANFTALHNRLYSSLFNFIRLRVKNLDEVEDLVQDVFLKAYRSWEGVPDDKTAQNFLFRIARQRLIDLWKSAHNRYTQDSLSLSEEFDVSDDGPLPEDIFIQSERKQEALKILNNLGPSERQILYLRFIEEKEYRELALIWGVTEDNARQKVSRALAKARLALRPK